jgi:alanine racemase
MHRLGVAAKDVAGYVSRLTRSNNVAGDVGFASHFSCADQMDGEVTTTQLQAFAESTQAFPGQKTIANSAGILYWPSSHYDYVRAGIALYGIAPNEDQIGQQHGLKPVMTLRSELIAIRDHQAGQPVGYGQTWFADKGTKIGVVALGYGDGYPRLAPAGTPVWVNGRIVPIVGRVSMDMITVDLSIDSTDKVGDKVEFWGNNLPIETVAKAVGTIPYELTIKLTRRVVKSYI